MLKKDKVSIQQVILVDENDNFLGEYAPRHEAHIGKGLHHRAFVYFVLNKKGEILLQKRKHWLWDGLWDLTAISHPLHLEGRDESYQEAASRALKREMGIEGVEVEKIGGFNYYAKHEEDGLPAGRQGCENEYCAVLFGRYSGPVKPSEEDVYEYKWMSFANFIKDIKKQPQIYTPWAILTIETLKTGGKLKELFS